jgi:hypothetical protein
MDRTLINIASILVGGAGIFTVLTGFNVPQLNMSFWGENPYSVKRDAIESAMTWIFTGFATLGLLLQLGAEIWGAELPDRSHGWKYYGLFTISGFVAVAWVVWLLTGVGTFVARKQWQPRIITLQREPFDRAKFVVEHDGWTREHWQKGVVSEAETPRYRAEQFTEAEKYIKQIEDLLEVKPTGDLAQRVASLEPFFQKEGK